jgi:large subunit ribosomal protein L18
MKNINLDRKLRRKRRVSKNIFGTKEKPRISVFRSNRYIYAQAVDDVNKLTIVSLSSLNLLKDKDFKKSKKTDEARQVGLGIAKNLKEKKIDKGVFDRGLYAYKGRVKALAEGLREGGFKI